MKAPWITHRPEIKVLDCTIRDGGLCNEHRFDDEFVRAVYRTCLQAGIDYIELGYKASRRQFATESFGAWKFTEEDAIRRIVDEESPGIKISIMADAGKTDWQTDIVPKSQSIIDTVRVACYVHQIDEAILMIKDAHDKGYETTCNIMAISTVREAEIDQALDLLAETPVNVIVVVDSYGALYGEQISLLVKKYRNALGPLGVEVGIHAHNNQQLAFANTIEAVIHGASRLDATMGGLGRGAGNCPMELLLGFLRNPKFKTRPVWKLIQEQLCGIRDTVKWGPYPPYMVTGQLNQHPRTAISWMSGTLADNCLDFYDKATAEE